MSFLSSTCVNGSLSCGCFDAKLCTFQSRVQMRGTGLIYLHTQTPLGPCSIPRAA